jgi:hypothetical protein
MGPVADSMPARVVASMLGPVVASMLAPAAAFMAVPAAVFMAAWGRSLWWPWGRSLCGALRSPVSSQLAATGRVFRTFAQGWNGRRTRSTERSGILKSRPMRRAEKFQRDESELCKSSTVSPSKFLAWPLDHKSYLTSRRRRGPPLKRIIRSGEIKGRHPVAAFSGDR